MVLRRWCRHAGVGALLASLLLAIATTVSIRPMPHSLHVLEVDTAHPPVISRGGVPLSVTYSARFNVQNVVPLHRIPTLLQQAFVYSEDKRFFSHHGVDWIARVHALVQDTAHLHIVRGASTITEQVVRLIHPRPRTFWSRWVEGFEANALEQRFNKADILEFYLNQVPYAAQRRGVVQASHYYFGRDLDTLTPKELLALAALVRAPDKLDMNGDPRRINKEIMQLAGRLVAAGVLQRHDLVAMQRERFSVAPPKQQLEAGHFVQYVHSLHPALENGVVHSTLNAQLEADVQHILDNRLLELRRLNVHNGAVLVVDNRSNQIVAWAVGGETLHDVPGAAYNAVTVPRQPGSTLKPFVYSLAIERGWTPATIIRDAPLSEQVGDGMHSYHNYSRTYYGNVRLRVALANSLNIPAVRALEFVGPATLLKCLRAVGVRSLDANPDFYGDGLALGDGEISLYELVQAYSTLARHGSYLPLTANLSPNDDRTPKQVFSPQVTSLISNILSDPTARALEFGVGGVLNLPVQTAVKTGTSSDYRDAWTVGYNYRYTVGVWMGNLDRTAMRRVTGSLGPALVLRSVFAALNWGQETRPLYMSPGLVKRTICMNNGKLAHGDCPQRTEWFLPDHLPGEAPPEPPTPVRIREPSYQLELAVDPRIPQHSQEFKFQLTRRSDYRRVDWYVDGHLQARTRKASYLWPLARGKHAVQVRVWLKGHKQYIADGPVPFLVK